MKEIFGMQLTEEQTEVLQGLVDELGLVPLEE